MTKVLDLSYGEIWGVTHRISFKFSYIIRGNNTLILIQIKK
jgi:hypothetical protein